MNETKKQLISLETIKILKSRFDSFPKDTTITRNAPFHKAFLCAFESKFNSMNTDSDALLNMSSWVHGLNTTLGQSFFESVAHILCDGGKKAFPGSDHRIYDEQERVIAEHMTDLKNGTKPPCTAEEDVMLKEAAHGNLIVGTNFTADCFFEDDEKIVAIEMKSVRPNSGETRGEKQKILKAKAELRQYYKSISSSKDKEIYYFFGFPFDPTAKTETGYDKKRFMENMIEFSKFCAPEDILLADELWSFLSGEKNTMEEILKIIKDISKPSFSSDFDFLCSAHSIEKDSQRYSSIAEKWHLYDEIKLIDNWQKITSVDNKTIIKLRNASPFNEDGKYNERRISELLSVIN